MGNFKHQSLRDRDKDRDDKDRDRDARDKDGHERLRHVSDVLWGPRKYAHLTLS